MNTVNIDEYTLVNGAGEREAHRLCVMSLTALITGKLRDGGSAYAADAADAAADAARASARASADAARASAAGSKLAMRDSLQATIYEAIAITE